MTIKQLIERLTTFDENSKVKFETIFLGKDGLSLGGATTDLNILVPYTNSLGEKYLFFGTEIKAKDLGNGSIDKIKEIFN